MGSSRSSTSPRRRADVCSYPLASGTRIRTGATRTSSWSTSRRGPTIAKARTSTGSTPRPTRFRSTSRSATADPLLLVGPVPGARVVVPRGLLGVALPVALDPEPEEQVEQQHGDRGAGGHEEALPAGRPAAVDDQQHAAEQEDARRQSVAERDHQRSRSAG